MNNEEKYSDARWTEQPIAKVVSRRELSEEEAKENKKRLREHLIKTGVIQPDETPFP